VIILVRIAIILHVFLDFILLVALEIRCPTQAVAPNVEVSPVVMDNTGNNALSQSKYTRAKRVPPLRIAVLVLSGQRALEYKSLTYNVQYVLILSHVPSDSIEYLAMEMAKVLQHAQVAHH